MSKFFKALEKLEQENEARDRGEVDTTAVATAASAAEVEAPPDPRHHAPRVPPRPERPERTERPERPASRVASPIPTVPRAEPIVEPRPQPRAEPIVEPPPRPRVEPIVESRPQPRVEPRAEPIVEPPPRPRAEPIVESRPQPRVEPPAGPRVERRPEPVVPPVASPAPVTAPAQPVTYGAPVVREPSAPRKHSRAFTVETDAGDVAEPGELDDHLVSVLEPTSFAAEQYRAARLAIETFRRERGTRIVGVSSPGRGDGKTITAVNLAGALAQAPDARVVLLDADLRHPGAARYLGLSAARGLSTYLLDTRTTVDDIVERPDGLTFAVIPAGPVSSMPYELLKSPRLASLLAALRDRFDYVVVDTPSVLPYPDVGILRDAVDGFVMVVRANRTTREMLRDSLNAVGRPRTLGLIYNDDDRSAISVAGDEAEESRWKRYLAIGGTRA